MGRIQTGVDRLVELVHQQHKLSVDAAAKSLGVSKAIITEWADFLEEEGIIDVKYSLSNTYLIERAMSKGEAEAKTKQFSAQRETFIQKVETTIAQIENETANFENFKKEFKSLQGDLGNDLKAMEKELKELQEYDRLRAEVRTDLEKQHIALEKKKEEADSNLQRDYKRYHELLQQAAAQEKDLEEKHAKVHVIIHSEAEASKKLTEYMNFLQQLKKSLDSEESELEIDSKTLDKIHKAAQEYHGELATLEKKHIRKLEDLHAAHASKVKQLEQKVLAKASTLKLTNSKTTPKALQQKMGEFFKRKQQIEDLLHSVDKDKIELQKELKELHQKAEAYRVSKSVLGFDELEGKLKAINEHRTGLQGKLKKFLHILK